MEAELAKVVVDASVWVSSLRSQDVNNEASRLWMEKYINQNGLLIAPTLLLLEVAAAISRRTGESTLAREAVKTLTSASSMHFIQMDATLVQEAVHVAADLQLRAGDAMYVAVARMMNIPLVSWDKEQLQKAAASLLTCTPSEYVFQDYPLQRDSPDTEE